MNGRKFLCSLGFVAGMLMMGGDGAGWPWTNFTGFAMFASSLYGMSKIRG